MSRRAVLWVVFAVVHVLTAVLGFVLPSEPMGDVYRVYEPWSLAALQGQQIVGIDSIWVYPQLALVPMILTHGLAWIGGYTLGWAILVTAVDAVAFAVLVGRGRSVGRLYAAWFWLASLALLGPVGIYRLDGLTVPIVILGCLWLFGRPWLASILLTAATWMKVWPAALLVAAVIAVRRRMAIVGAAVVLSAMVIVSVVVAGGSRYLFGFIADQADRGLQVEAPISAVYLWQAVFGVPGSTIYYDYDMLTFQVTGPQVDVVIALMTPLLVVAMVLLMGLGAYAAWRGASFGALFPPLSLAFVLALIVFNKVGSPQYMVWLVPSLVLALMLDRRRWLLPATGALIASALTFIVYPLIYDRLLEADSLAAAVLTLRNLVWIALLVWAVVRLVQIVRRPRIRSLTASPGGF